MHHPLAGAAPDLKRRVVEFVGRASTEVTTHDEKHIRELSALLPPGSTVYVAHTPKAAFEDVVRVAISIQSAGFRASPHLVARRLPGERDFREGLRRLVAAGVDRALLVAGDRDTPVGPYADTLDVLSSGVLEESGLRRLGVAGHPEGHHAATASQLSEALRVKQAFGERSGIAVHIVTQFGFDSGAIVDWSDRTASEGISLPIHAGIAGPVSAAKLLRFAMQCGVGASLQHASKNLSSISSMVRAAATPEEMVARLVELTGGRQPARIVQPHFFTFGAALATAKWIERVANGAFSVRAGGNIAVDG